jgi:hypothetical protein
MRRVVIGLTCAFMLAAASLGSALAKEGEVVATLDPPQSPHAGQPTTFSVTLARPDGRPVTGDKVTFVVARVSDAQVLRAVATEQAAGHYVASITLAQPGSWVVSVRAVDPGGMAQSFSLGTVRALAALPAAAQTSRSAASTLMVPVWMLAIPLVLGAVLALGGVWGMGTLRRRRLTPAGAGAPQPGAGVSSAAEHTQA